MPQFSIFLLCVGCGLAVGILCILVTERIHRSLIHARLHILAQDIRAHDAATRSVTAVSCVGCHKERKRMMQYHYGESGRAKTALICHKCAYHVQSSLERR